MSKKVAIKKNVWIRELCNLPGVTIGEGSIIGSMSVVNKNIPARSIAVGAPAKVVKVFNDEKNMGKGLVENNIKSLSVSLVLHINDYEEVAKAIKCVLESNLLV